MPARTAPQSKLKQQRPRRTEGASGPWRYLESRPESWYRTLFVKGSRARAASIWAQMRAESHTAQEAAEDFGLPIEAIAEIVLYCKANKEAIEAEWTQEAELMEQGGVILRPSDLDRRMLQEPTDGSS